MLTLLCLDRRAIVLAAMAWGCAAGGASAQALDPQSTPPSLADVGARVPIGGVVHVTDTTGRAMTGTLTAVTDDSIQVLVKAGMRTVAAADIRHIQWQQPDSPLTGVLIGAAIGAAPGVYWLIADPNECTGMCPEEYAFIAIGAAIGGVIDHVIHKKVTVFTARPLGGHAKSVAIGPLVTRSRKGVQIAVTF